MEQSQQTDDGWKYIIKLSFALPVWTNYFQYFIAQ